MLHRFASIGTRTLQAALAAAAVALAGSAHGQATITLFGQQYSVTRIDYSTGILLPNVAFPQDPPVPFIESEGLVWAGDNRLLFSADDIPDVGFGMPDNWIVEARLAISGGQVTGIESYRTIIAHDVVAIGYDLNPTGITINTGAGFGGGGNVVACFGDGRLYAYSFQNGVQIPFPAGAPGSGCVQTNPAGCAFDLSSQNTNAEDVTYAPVNGGEFFVVNQDTPTLERWNAVTGQFIASFPIGGAVPGGPAASQPKGVAYLADSPRLPASLRRTPGIVLVSFDDNYPALQAFDLTGNILGTELLTVDGQPGGLPRFEIGDCSLQLESLAYDPESGRIFLSNQGSLTLCNYLFVLTPVAACPTDFNGDGNVDPDDLSDFIACFFEAPPCSRADLNGDGNADPDDLSDYIGLFFGPAC